MHSYDILLVFTMCIIITPTSLSASLAPPPPLPASAAPAAPATKPVDFASKLANNEVIEVKKDRVRLDRQAVMRRVASESTKDRGSSSQLFWPAFIASISMILVSELGDKTFFIAAIMAMRYDRVTIFSAAISALVIMTILSAAMGFTIPNLIPREYVNVASVVLFLAFGVRLLHDAYHMDPSNGDNEELEEVETELDKKELESTSPEQLEAGNLRHGRVGARAYFSPVFLQCFTMTFLAEWGDRSQISTIALAAARNPFGVTLGGIIGHACCTSLAVYGGKLLATSISERTVSVVGGVLFLIFAVHGFFVPEI